MAEVDVDSLIKDGFGCTFDPVRNSCSDGLQTCLQGITKKQSA